jgi:hypothetical protein
VHQEQIDAIRAAEKGKAKGESLFPYVNFSQRQQGVPDANWETIASTLKHMQELHHWPKDLTFVPHSCRAGAMAGIEKHLKETGEVSEEKLKEATAITKPARRGYLESNESRIQRVRTGEKRKRETQGKNQTGSRRKA